MQWKKVIARVASSVVIMLLYFIPSFSQNALVGRWIDAAHKDKQIDIYVAKDSLLYGKNEAGAIVLKSIACKAGMNTCHGILINPEDGKAYPITINLLAANKFSFVVKKFLFSKTFTFEKLTHN